MLVLTYAAVMARCHDHFDLVSAIVIAAWEPGNDERKRPSSNQNGAQSADDVGASLAQICKAKHGVTISTGGAAQRVTSRIAIIPLNAPLH